MLPQLPGTSPPQWMPPALLLFAAGFAALALWTIPGAALADDLRAWLFASVGLTAPLYPGWTALRLLRARATAGRATRDPATIRVPADLVVFGLGVATVAFLAQRVPGASHPGHAAFAALGLAAAALGAGLWWSQLPRAPVGAAEPGPAEARVGRRIGAVLLALAAAGAVAAWATAPALGPLDGDAAGLLLLGAALFVVPAGLLGAKMLAEGSAVPRAPGAAPAGKGRGIPAALGYFGLAAFANLALLLADAGVAHPGLAVLAGLAAATAALGAWLWWPGRAKAGVAG